MAHNQDGSAVFSDGPLFVGPDGVVCHSRFPRGIGRGGDGGGGSAERLKQGANSFGVSLGARGGEPSPNPWGGKLQYYDDLLCVRKRAQSLSDKVAAKNTFGMRAPANVFASCSTFGRPLRSVVRTVVSQTMRLMS